MFSIKNREDLDELNELILLENQANEIRLQDKLGKQNFHENIKKCLKQLLKKNENTSEDSTKTMMLTSKENNKALENSNEKLLEIMNDRGIVASYLLSPLSKISNPEHTSQFTLVKDPSSNRAKDNLIKKTTPVTL